VAKCGRHPAALSKAAFHLPPSQSLSSDPPVASANSFGDATPTPEPDMEVRRAKPVELKAGPTATRDATSQSLSSEQATVAFNCLIYQITSNRDLDRIQVWQRKPSCAPAGQQGSGSASSLEISHGCASARARRPVAPVTLLVGFKNIDDLLQQILRPPSLAVMALI
jgi:hypothetical protein